MTWCASRWSTTRPGSGLSGYWTWHGARWTCTSTGTVGGSWTTWMTGTRAVVRLSSGCSCRLTSPPCWGSLLPEPGVAGRSRGSAAGRPGYQARAEVLGVPGVVAAKAWYHPASWSTISAFGGEARRPRQDEVCTLPGPPPQPAVHRVDEGPVCAHQRDSDVAVGEPLSGPGPPMLHGSAPRSVSVPHELERAQDGVHCPICAATCTNAPVPEFPAPGDGHLSLARPCYTRSTLLYALDGASRARRCYTRA